LDTDATDFTDSHGSSLKKNALFRVSREIRVQQYRHAELRNTLLRGASRSAGEGLGFVKVEAQ